MNAWHDEEIDQLRKLAEEGKSARAIAEAIGPRHTKNSVIGKAHRLGISLKGNRRLGPRPTNGVESVPRVVRPPQKVDRYVPIVREPPTFEPKPSPPSESPHVSWEDHTSGMCKCRYDDGTWCSGQRAAVTIGHRTIQSNWCEFHRQLFTVERKGRSR